MTPQDIGYISGTGEPGTGNGFPNGMLHGVAAELDRIAPGKFRHHTVDYWKQYGNPHSYAASRKQGTELAHKLLDQLGGAPLVGFSMGATIAGDVTHARADVSCGYLLADPLRPLGANSSGMPGTPGYIPPAVPYNGFGVGGQRPVAVARWYSIPGDVITDCRKDSLVRDVADVSEFMGFSSLDEMTRWGLSLVNKIQMQAWQNLPMWRRVLSYPLSALALPDTAIKSIQEGIGYPSIHVSYGKHLFPGTQRTYIQQMARHIAQDAGVLS